MVYGERETKCGREKIVDKVLRKHLTMLTSH